MVEFRMLGGLQCLAGSEPIPLGGARQRAVLALLLLEAPAPVSVRRVIDELWAEQPPATAPHAVEVYVSALRKALFGSGDEGCIRRSACGYALEVGGERIDARRFERLVDDAERAMPGRPMRACALLEQALGLWRGPPIEGLRRFEFARQEADRLSEIHSRAVESLAWARLESGEPGDVISVLTRLIAAHPLRERPRRLLMLALYRAGRHAEALAIYRDACGALAEVGLQPGPELRDLEARILRHDPSVHAAPPSSGSNGKLERKVVTALCCDLIGRSAHEQGLDPEARLSIVNRRFEEVRAVVERHGGALISSIGGSGTALFGVPRVREDDALRAVRAAVELAERASSPRIAVTTGPVLLRGLDSIVLGDPIDLALALQHAAEPGQILLGPETLALVRHAVQAEPVTPPPLSASHQPVAAARLTAIDWTAAALGRPGWSRAPASLLSCEAPGTASCTIAGAICSRCWARPASESRAWSRTCLPASVTRPWC